jgi:hypothetical protein
MVQPHEEQLQQVLALIKAPYCRVGIRRGAD